MMKKSIGLFILPGLLMCMQALAQQVPLNPKFGAVSQAEVAMTSYPADTSAAVLILYHNQKVEAVIDGRNGLMRREVMTERIKILKESGKDYPTYKIPFSVATDPAESVTGVKVVTWNLENGKLVKTQLAKKNIFQEKLSENYSALSFAAENVRVGSVVEVTWTFESPRVGDFGTLYLQKDVPINISELHVNYAECFTFNKMQQGFLGVTFTRDMENAVTMFGKSQYDYTLYKDNYKAVDVPAMRPEPYCYDPNQYRAAMDYDLRSFYIPGSVQEDFNTTWINVDQQLVDKGLLRKFHGNSSFADAVKILAAAAESEEALIAKVRLLVRGSVRWNKRHNIQPDVKKALKEGEGDTADMNALLGMALESVGYVADPVFYRLRSQGALRDYHVDVSSYTSVLLKITTPSGAQYLLDASYDAGTLNVLPPLALVSRGRVLNKHGIGSWVDLSEATRNNVNEVNEMTLLPDGSFHGAYTVMGFNQGAAAMKVDRLRFNSDEEYIEEYEQNKDIEVDSLGFTHLQDWSNQCGMQFRYEGEATMSGDRIYLKPFLTKYHSASAFTKEERKIPVEFAYPMQISYACTLTLPEGYTVESLPDPVSIAFPALQSQATLRCQVLDDRVVVRYMFRRNATFLPTEEYASLRIYWEQLCNIYNATIVLKK